jgi:hypothetical protein
MSQLPNFRTRFQEQIAYESQGLPVLVDELQDCSTTTALQNCTPFFPMIFVIKFLIISVTLLQAPYRCRIEVHYACMTSEQSCD